MKINLRGLEYFIIILGIFSKLYAEALMVMLAVILIANREGHIVISKNIIWGFVALFLWSSTAIILVGYTPFKFLQQFVLLFYFFAMYYIIFRNNSISELFGVYLKFAYVLSILGLIQFVIQLATGFDIFFIFNSVDVLERDKIRLSSICAEPSVFSRLITPALGYYLFKDSRLKEERLKFAVILSAMILTFSTMSFVVVFIMVLYKYIVLKRNLILRVSFLIMTLFVSGFVYSSITQKTGTVGKGALSDISVKLRDVSTGLKHLTPENIELLNLSSYATLMNVWVALNSDNRLIGTGLGTHQQNYENNYKSDFKHYGLNMQEGYALSTRVYSEFGLLGILLLLFFIFKCHNRKNIINISTCFIIITLLFRGGHYSVYGTIFFFFLYYYTSKYAFPTEGHTGDTNIKPSE